jgi:hypothetical protein
MPCLQTQLIRQSSSNTADINTVVICSRHGSVHIMKRSICVQREHKQGDTSRRGVLCCTLIGSREDVGHFMSIEKYFPPPDLSLHKPPSANNQFRPTVFSRRCMLPLIMPGRTDGRTFISQCRLKISRRIQLHSNDGYLCRIVCKVHVLN